MGAEARCPHCGSVFTLETQDDAFPDDLGFEVWWAKYPRKVGKLAAARLYRRTVTQRLATPAQLMDGLKRYCTYKPDDQPWCHPKTWLSEGRWDDIEPEAAWEARRAAPEPVRAPRLVSPAPAPIAAIEPPADPAKAEAVRAKLAALASSLKAR